jgi:hypothetical protein
MKTTCVCCGKRASHESVRTVGGAWYRCNSCNYAWRGLRAYLISLIANIWWPIKGPSYADAVPRPISKPPGHDPNDGPGDGPNRPDHKLRTRVSDDARAGNGAGWNTRGGGRAA